MSVCSSFDIPIYYILNSILNVVAVTFILFFFSGTHSLVVNTAIQNKGYVSQSPRQSEVRFLLIECCLVASRVLWTKTGVCPLPFLVYFSSHFLPGAQPCWPELSLPHWSWGQGPYSEDVGQWCRKLSVLWGLSWPELAHMVLPASGLPHTKEMHFYYV